MPKRKPETQQHAPAAPIGTPLARDLDDAPAVVTIKRTVGHVACMAFHFGDAKHADGRTAEVLGSPGGIVVTIKRAGAEPFVVTFTTEALVRAAFAAEEAHRATDEGRAALARLDDMPEAP